MVEAVLQRGASKESSLPRKAGSENGFAHVALSSTTCLANRGEVLWAKIGKVFRGTAEVS